MNPQGGTELQHGFLDQYADKNLLNQVQITTSVPEKIPLHPSKPNILWQKNSYDQPNIAPWFSQKTNHKKYDWYVFNSNWSYEKFRMMFDLPTERCHVIKNGCTSFPTRKPYKKGDPIRIIHQNTPWRGLSVLLGAMQLVKNPLIKLDVFSSTEVYGEEFKKRNDHTYVPLYKQASELPNVNYIGYKPNFYILENLNKYNMYVYPSIFEETSCISAIECLSAGLYSIVTNFGALYETCAEFPMYVTYTKDLKILSQTFATAIEMAAQTLHETAIQDSLDMQQDFYKKYYNWNKRALEWNNFLYNVINEKK
jgi:glycosyltransferase involved in cell wall biosynthesis